MKNQDLINQVDHLAQQLAEGITYQQAGFNHEERGCQPNDLISAYDYTDKALDIEYTISSSGAYLGASLLITFGGPNIRINTRTCTVEGSWWGDSYNASYTDSMGLDDACKELFQTVYLEV